MPSSSSALAAGSCTHVENEIDRLRKPLRQILADIDAWAEGDEIASDGIELRGDDLLGYLIRHLTEPLMEYYVRRRKVEKAGRRMLNARLELERYEVAAFADSVNKAAVAMQFFSDSESEPALSESSDEQTAIA